MPLEEPTLLRRRDALSRRARVLVVDDDVLVGLALCRILRREHDAVAACDPAAALDLLRAGARFDLVVSDLRMPGLSGLELYRVVRAELADETPFIVLTASELSEEERRFADAERLLVLDKLRDLDALEGAVAERVAARRSAA